MQGSSNTDMSDGGGGMFSAYTDCLIDICLIYFVRRVRCSILPCVTQMAAFLV